MNPANPIQDQIDAAARDALNRIKTVGERNQYEVRNYGPVVRAIVTRWFEEGGDQPEQAMCAHVAGSPQVVFSAAPFPGVTMCSDCFVEMWRTYTDLMYKIGKGRPCDGCHQFVPGGKTGVLTVGPMLMTASMCHTCCTIDDAGAPSE